MDNLHLAEVSLDLSKKENWERIGKFVVTNGLVSIVICLTILIILELTGGGSLTSAVLILLVVFMGHALALSWYENWRGCRLE